jgi:two-component system, NarL family, invasion response regulator UvrY
MEVKRNIVLLDDHVIIRNGLKELIEKIGPFKILQQFDNGAEFIASISERKDIDLIILDINMPGMNGDVVMERLNKEGISIPVLILTVSEDEEMMVRLFRLGVRGYLKKNCESSELRAALNEILDSGYYHNEFLTYSLRANANANKKNAQQQIIEQLTDREKEFLKLVCHENEYKYEQIADIMHVQHRTVDGYRESIFDKFGIKSKTGLVLFVLKHNLFEHL